MVLWQKPNWAGPVWEAARGPGCCLPQLTNTQKERRKPLNLGSVEPDLATERPGALGQDVPPTPGTAPAHLSCLVWLTMDRTLSSPSIFGLPNSSSFTCWQRAGKPLAARQGPDAPGGGHRGARHRLVTDTGMAPSHAEDEQSRQQAGTRSEGRCPHPGWPYMGTKEVLVTLTGPAMWSPR